MNTCYDTTAEGTGDVTAAARFTTDLAQLPECEYLPDLFTFSDGTQVQTPDDWARRRLELRDMLQFYLYGCKHPTPEGASSLRILSDDERDKMTRKPFFPGFPEICPEAAIDITDGGKTASITLDAFRVPQNSRFTAPYPAVICVGGLPEEQITTLLNEGYAYIAFDTASVYSDGGDNPRTGAYCELYPYREGEYEFDSGVLLGWAWGVSRVIDALKNDPATGIAWDKCAVTGCSRNGKAAVLAAVFDDRIAIAAPSDPGGGGLTGFRCHTEGQLHCYGVPDGCDTVYSRNETAQRAIANPSESAWFCSNAQMFVHGNYRRAPFDLHAVAALIAPRPLICHTGEAQQSWLNSPATALNMEAAAEVYEFLGEGGNIACVVRDGPHANQDRDLPDIVAVLDYTFRRSDTLTVRTFDALRGDDGMARDGSGVFRKPGEYLDIRSLSRNPYHTENRLIRTARPGKHYLWSCNSFLSVGTERTVTFFTDAQYVVFDNTRILTKEGRAEYTFIPEQAGEYTATAMGVLDSCVIRLACLTPSEALRCGLNLTGGSPDGMAVGFTSPVTRYPTVLVDGEECTAGENDDGTAQVYNERFGVSLKLPGIPEKERFTLTLQDFELEALPGKPLSLNIELYKTKMKNWMGMEVDALAADCGEIPFYITED